MLVITHYQRLLDYIVPDKVHVMADGRIQKSGGKELALELEKTRLCRVSGQGRVRSAADEECSARKRNCRPARTRAGSAGGAR